ncbi:uncharacterized protein [Argopecten irradians]|uniref:uncharacterized protein n=1 Tax=Argopecten irradians TaxID=31199 RepID=UPI003710A9BC
MPRVRWTPVWLIQLVTTVMTSYPGSWNCSSEPEVPCIAYDIIDDSRPPESDYLCLDQFFIKHQQNHTDQGTMVSWTFLFNDSQIDGFCVETPNLWRVLLLQDLDVKSSPLQLNLKTSIDDNGLDDGDIQIHPLVTQRKYWDHTTKMINFYTHQISTQTLTVILSSDTADLHYVAERLRDSCSSPDTVSDIVKMVSNTVTFSNMTSGNYCFLFTPQDPYPNDPARCLCYHGTTRLRQCFPCSRSSFNYIMEGTMNVNGTAATNSSLFLKTVTFGSLGGCLIVIVFVVVFIIRRRQIRNCLLGSKLYRRKVLILATYDSDAHRQAVKCLGSCLETCRCNVQIISNDDLATGNSFQNVQHVTASFDIIIIIVSQQILTLLEELQCSGKKNMRLETLNIILVKALQELLQRNESNHKIVTVHYSSSQNVQHMTNILSGSNFHLIDEFINLLLKIHYTDQTLSVASRECSEMMKQLENTNKFSELKCLTSSFGLIETSNSGGKTPTARLQSLNVDYGIGSSFSHVNGDTNTLPFETNLSDEEVSKCSVWSDSGRKHHDRTSLQHNSDSLSGIAACECDVNSLTTIGEFSV